MLNVPTFSCNSFFAGGGLLDFAFKTKFNIHWASELNPQAAICYRANIGDHILVGDIQEINYRDIPLADIFIGGPPCVDFASSGKGRGINGIHGKLSWRYRNIIRARKPKAFVFENVIGMAQRHKATLDKLIHSFNSIGYNVGWQMYDAANFGTPQHRKRIFIVGIRKDLGFTFEFPTPPMEQKTVFDAIGDLPIPETINIKDKYIGIISNHVTTWTSPSPQRLLDVLENPRPNQWKGIKKLKWDSPSHTLLAHISKDGREFVHPDELRRITVRECLRVMGFPDDFVIPKEVTLTNQYKLTNNGVAFQVGVALADALYKQLSLNFVSANCVTPNNSSAKEQLKNPIQMDLFEMLEL